MARNGRNGDLTRAIGAKAIETERMAHKMLERNGNGNSNGNGNRNGQGNGYGDRNGNGNGYGHGEGNTTYGASTFGVAGRNGRDNMTLKELVAMPKGERK